MDLNKVIELNNQLDHIVNKNQDLIGNEAAFQKRECSVTSADEIKETIENMQNSERILQVGIVGRVKAGKSSLLNALIFNGENILPKAATPMTAALTQLSWGEKLSADVEFYTEKDIENIREKALEYEMRYKEIKRLRKEELKEQKKRRHKEPLDERELEEKVEKRVSREMKNKFSDLEGFHDQYEKIQKVRHQVDLSKRIITLKADTESKLMDLIYEYVGAKGKYMPFTKSVHVRLPNESLKDIEIIDTPGLNDPIASREERTRQLLKYCHAIFIVSPAGQFLSAQDQDLIGNISSKQGVREIYVIPSKVDSELYASEKEEANGDLQLALKNIDRKLADHMCATLKKIKEQYQINVFDHLIEQGENNVLHSSGISVTLSNHFDKRENWDETAKHVWGNLTKHYPAYFSDNDKDLSIANLNLLSNMPEIENRLENVKTKKDELLDQQVQNQLDSSINALSAYRKALIHFIENENEMISSSAVDELRENKGQLEKSIKNAKTTLNFEFEDMTQELSINIRAELKRVLESNFKETKNAIKESKGTKEESYTTGWWLWKKTEYETVKTVNTGIVKDALEELTYSIQEDVDLKAQELIRDWKRKLTNGLLKILRSCVDDQNLKTDVIRRAIRSAIDSVEYPELDYSDAYSESDPKEDVTSENATGWWVFNNKYSSKKSISQVLNKTGTITDYEAEEFIDTAKKFVSKFRKRVAKDIKAYVDLIAETLKTTDISGNIFSSYFERIDNLEQQINNKEITLDKLSSIKKELQEIDV